MYDIEKTGLPESKKPAVLLIALRSRQNLEIRASFH
jgi:hypothetical protein